MANLWDEREKAIENEYFRKIEREQLRQLRTNAEQETIYTYCHDRCPKCGEPLEAMSFRDVPLDRCPGCGGIWLGPNDLKILSQKDHRSWFESWFERWFKSDED